MILVTLLPLSIGVQAALVICGLAIRGTDYRGKLRIARENPNFKLKKPYLAVVVFAVYNIMRSLTPTNSEGNLYCGSFNLGVVHT
jgi:hypothetical protein